MDLFYPWQFAIDFFFFLVDERFYLFIHFINNTISVYFFVLNHLSIDA